MSNKTQNVKDVINDYKSIVDKENTLKLSGDAKNAAIDGFNKTKATILNIKGIGEFFRASILGIIYISIYFYFGSSFLLLCKNAQKSPEGIPGQDIKSVPYIGNFEECKNTKQDFQSLDKWSFPYKNDILCNKDFNVNRPLIFRYVSYITSIMAFSYSSGRKILNALLSVDQTSAMMFGPIIMFFIMLSTPFISWGTTIFGCISSIDKMLPNCYFSFWFPFATLFLIMGTVFMFPNMMAMLHSIHVLLYILYPTFGKLDFVENGFNKKTKGFASVFYTMTKSSIYLISLFIWLTYNAVYHLETVISIPLVILSTLIIYLKFFI